MQLLMTEDEFNNKIASAKRSGEIEGRISFAKLVSTALTDKDAVLVGKEEFKECADSLDKVLEARDQLIYLQKKPLKEEKPKTDDQPQHLMSEEVFNYCHSMEVSGEWIGYTVDVALMKDHMDLKRQVNNLKKAIEEALKNRTCTEHEIGKCPSSEETIYRTLNNALKSL